ncbi:hypothetical protein [Rhodobacter calidifons]|uniref:Uncharacterized protein n=1 Tax=Rhodobacter calidifons TaxID=2715277 RepID=A0ABX0G6G2_9RHOB|nr:hypothetical protein [Rhodobacter calidifons]NHB76686.1 hypothetical protein [Rhodobacter calidifons]
MRVGILVWLLTAQPLAAQTLMTAEEFDDWSRGKTLDYAVDGQILGSETYFAGRRVRDADRGGPCIDGSWFADGEAICFVYPAIAGVHCWHYWREGETVVAQPLSAAPDTPPQQVTEASAPLACTGPDVGV